MKAAVDRLLDDFVQGAKEILDDSPYSTPLGLNMARDARRLQAGQITQEQFVKKYQAQVEKEFGERMEMVKEPERKGVRWGMVIDLRKCVGCDTCTVSCKAENRTPPGVSYNIVLEQEKGTFPNVTRVNLPRPCMQCDRPPCVSVCPVRATYKRDDGIVAIDNDRCIGCRYCMVACPYGARSFDFGESYEGEMIGYDAVQAPEYGMKQGKRKKNKTPIGTVRKCSFCYHRLQRGEEPACVETCIGDARYFGNLDDPNSVVSKLAKSPRAFRLKQELGTKPRVIYLM